MVPGQTQYHYLDLKPDTVVRDGVSHQRRDLLHWGPAKCFYEDDLYALQVRGLTSDGFEKRFFGEVDRRGREAVETFGSYSGFSHRVHENFLTLPTYIWMPKDSGLLADWISSVRWPLFVVKIKRWQ